MPVDLIREEDLRLALKPRCIDPEQFRTGVLQRLKERARESVDPLYTMPRVLRTAASLLPLEVLTGGQSARTAGASVSVASALAKLVGFVAFPAISLFVILGSAILGVTGIRKVQSAETSGTTDLAEFNANLKQWWQVHHWGGWLLTVATIALAWYGATWLMFLGYILSTLILVYILKSFARIGIGNRLIVGQSCAMGLALLGQTAGYGGMGDEDIHLIDQHLLVPIFIAGAVVVSLIMNWGQGKALRSLNKRLILFFGLCAAIWLILPIFLVQNVPSVFPASPEQIHAYVESFDRAEFSSASWRQWEIVASWSIQAKPDLDLSRPQELLAKEIKDEQNLVLPAILGSAFHGGVVKAEHIDRLKNYPEELRALLEQPRTYRISSLDLDDWLIRAAILRGDLTNEQKEYLVERLHLSLKSFLSGPQRGTLQGPLLATQLLEALGKPVDPDVYRNEMQEVIMRFHSTAGSGSTRAGGFKAYESLAVGDLDATADAVRLMEVYGVPRNLDVNWVRSFLHPSMLETSPQKWVAAVTRDRLNRLPGMTQPSWYQALYYERNFVAAIVLIGLCIYATAISPRPRQRSFSNDPHFR